MSLFGEAIRSAFLPCSFALLIPAVVVTALSRSSTRLATVGVYLTAASLLAWLPFIRVTTPLDHNLGGAIALGAGLTIFLKTRGLGASLGAGALLGAFAGSTWIPCVGAEFGGILNSGLEQPSSALIPMLIYVLGVLMPIGVIIALLEFVPAARRLIERHAVRWTAVGIGAALGVVVLVGAYPTLLSELARRSTL